MSRRGSRHHHSRRRDVSGAERHARAPWGLVPRSLVSRQCRWSHESSKATSALPEDPDAHRTGRHARRRPDRDRGGKRGRGALAQTLGSAISPGIHGRSGSRTAGFTVRIEVGAAVMGAKCARRARLDRAPLLFRNELVVADGMGEERISSGARAEPAPSSREQPAASTPSDDSAISPHARRPVAELASSRACARA